MVGKRTALTKRKANRKGLLATGAGAGSVALLAIGSPWFLVAAGAVGTGWLLYDWLRFRGKNGLYF